MPRGLTLIPKRPSPSSRTVDRLLDSQTVGERQSRLTRRGLMRTAAAPLLSIAGCRRERAASRIVIATFDSMRADAAISPNLKALADDGISFSRAYAPAPWTLPSLASMLTGLSPFAHGVRTYDSGLPVEALSIPRLLSENGFATALIGFSPFFEPDYGLTAGFGDLEAHWRTSRNNPTGRALPMVGSPDLTLGALKWLRAHRDEPFFLWVHYYDPHLPYAPPSEWLPDQARFGAFYDDHDTAFRSMPLDAARSTARQLYDAEVRFVDSQLGKILRLLRELAVYDDTLVVAASDHGEEFWEHGSFAHGRSLYDEVLRIPLVIKPPWRGGPTISREQVSLEALFPTIADVAGLTFDSSALSHRSLRDVIEGRGEGKPASPLLATSVTRGEDQVAVRFGRWKCIVGLETDEALLFDVENDPLEQDDVAASEASAMATARSTLQGGLHAELLRKEALGMPPRPVSPADQRLERLRTLGYVQ